MKGVNKVFLLGSVGKDPEIRSTAGGTVVASFSLATSDREKGQDGQWQDKTEWHNIVAFTRTAEVVRDYVKKGTPLFIEGKVQTRSWDDKQSGEKKYRTEILCNELVLLGSKGESAAVAPAAGRAGSSTPRTATGQQVRTVAAPAARAAAADPFEGLGITEDDLPF